MKMDTPKVLIVDDDPLFVEATQVLLERLGYEVISAGDGNAGVDLARREHPDAIILDLFMTPKDGFSVCEELRSDPRTASCPILVMSAVQQKMHKSVWSPEISLRLDADAFLDKPAEVSLLADHLARLIAKTRKARG